MSQNDVLYYVTHVCQPDDGYFDVRGAVGCLMVFEAYQAALNFADGKEYLVEVMEKAPESKQIQLNEPQED